MVEMVRETAFNVSRYGYFTPSNSMNFWENNFSYLQLLASSLAARYQYVLAETDPVCPEPSLVNLHRFQRIH